MLNVFLCWSGELSKRVAAELRDWLPDVIHVLKPWCSETDISSGQPWFEEIEDKVASTYFGILCLTPENRESTWLHYEAGGLRKGLAENRVVPLLIGLDEKDLDPPFSLLQFRHADSDGIFRLLSDMNSHLDSEYQRSEDQLRRSFTQNWPGLESAIQGHIDAVRSKDSVPERTEAEILSEVLSLVRTQHSALARVIELGFAQSEGIELIQNHLMQQPTNHLRGLGRRGLLSGQSGLAGSTTRSGLGLGSGLSGRGGLLTAAAGASNRDSTDSDDSDEKTEDGTD